MEEEFVSNQNLGGLFDMEDIDFKNLNIPEEVAPYAKQIFTECRNDE